MFTSITRSNASGSTAAKVFTGPMIPALAISTSMPPEPVDHPAIVMFERGCVADIGDECFGAREPSDSATARNPVPVAIDQGDLGAVGDQEPGGGFADATARRW